MASYDDSSLKEEPFHPHPQHIVPQYPPPPDENSSANASFNDQLYPNTDPALQPAHQPVALHPAPLPQQHASTPKVQKSQGHGENGESKEVKNRLRKACDSCSIRKVKCDENSPCKACVSLEIPCTFDRPSKRRGPPNRHADAIKKQRTDSPGHAEPQPGSPTHAAHTLASFSQQQVLTIETIMPWPVLSSLVDDYFTFIHPLIPVPHEPSFRQALQRREDLENRTFLALTASMLGCLLASFPRRARQHLRNMKYEEYFPNSMSMVDRCRKVAVEAQGSASFQRRNTIHDAIICYLQGMTSAYIFEQDSSLLYFSQCLAICTTLGLYRSTPPKPSVQDPRTPRMTANGQDLQGPQLYGERDLILQELGRRTFWIIYVSAKSLEQLKTFPFGLDIAPASKTSPHPSFPLEVEDEFLTPQQVFPQPSDVTTQLVGFNLNARIFSFYEQISTNELVHGVDEVFNWERQKAELEECLQKIKELIEQLPPKLQSTPQQSSSSSKDLQHPSPADQRNSTQQAPAAIAQDGISKRATIQLEIQKANIHVNQLSIRSYLVEKYWTLRARRNTTSVSAANDSQHLLSLASTSASALTEAAMTAERLEIAQNFLSLVSSLSQIAVEPNALSIIPKLRAIASTLLGTTRTAPSTDPSSAKGDRQRKTTSAIDGDKKGTQVTQEEHIESFFTALVRLEAVLPANENPAELDEEAQLNAWAELWVAQERYVPARDKVGTEAETSGR